jgi:hypothetical protein
MTEKNIEHETKEERQRRLIKSIEEKLNSSAEVGTKMEIVLLSELEPKKIEEFFQTQNLDSVELSNIQIFAFSRMIQAEQRLKFLKHVFQEILVELSLLKEAVNQKHGGGRKRKVPLDTATSAFTKVGLRNKSMPKKEEFAKELQLLITGSSDTDAAGKYVVSERTIDTYMKRLKLILVDIHLKSQKIN